MPVRRVRVAWLHTGAWCCARPTGDKHGRITRGPAHRRGGAKRKPRWVEAHKARPRTVYDAATGVNVQTSGTTVSGGALTGGGCISYRGEAIGYLRSGGKERHR